MYGVGDVELPSEVAVAIVLGMPWTEDSWLIDESVVEASYTVPLKTVTVTGGRVDGCSGGTTVSLTITPDSHWTSKTWLAFHSCPAWFK